MSSPSIDLDRAHVAIVMPVFNEADGIEEFVHELDQEVRRLVGELTIVIVDDASTDDTPAVVERVARSVPGLVYQRNEANLGHGPTAVAAYSRGLAEGAEIVVHVDGDGQFFGTDVMRLIGVIADGENAAVGIREGRTDPWFRRVLTRSLVEYLRLVARVRTSDANCPLRGYRREALQRLLENFPAAPMVPSVYLTVLEHRLAISVRSVPVRSRPRRGATETGSTWGPQPKAWAPSARLVKFVRGAARESLRTIPRLGKEERRS